MSHRFKHPETYVQKKSEPVISADIGNLFSIAPKATQKAQFRLKRAGLCAENLKH